ncbi:MAG: CPBP family intramembrane metalloprotease [Verrucomicrobiae bacterium]|nr:CPBP family intramembrane metalloprotease [Verrucomicrobiae bacterium]
MTQESSPFLLKASPTTRWLVVGPALVLPLLASFFYFVLFPGTSFGNGFYAAIKVFLLVWPPLATLVILRESLRREMPHLIGRRRSMLWGALFGIGIVGLMLALKEFSPMGALMEQNGARVREKVDGLGMLDHFALAACAISIVHAALEEFYWRWFVYGNLRHLVPQPWAHVIAAVGFMSHHIVITSQFFPLGFAIFLGVCVGIGGAFWSWLYQRHKSLWGPWFSHMLIDFGIFWIGYRLLFSH